MDCFVATLLAMTWYYNKSHCERSEAIYVFQHFFGLCRGLDLYDVTLLVWVPSVFVIKFIGKGGWGKNLF